MASKSRVAGSFLGLLALGYRARDAGLLHDQVSGVALNDPFDLRVFMAGNEEETARVLAHAPVSVRLDCELLGAACVRAFTEVDRLERRAPMLLLKNGDVLVDLTEERLVPRRPLLPK